MNIAKASKEDINACIDLAALLNTVDDGYYPSSEEDCDETFFDPDDKAHLRLFYDKVKACMDTRPGGINRVVWGFASLDDSQVFDPALSYLALHPRLTGEGAVTLKGKVCEVGNLENSYGRGVFLQVEGEEVEILGLSEEQCRDLVKHLGKVVTVTIAACDEVQAQGSPEDVKKS